MPLGVRLMPIAAKPCSDKSWNANYRRSPALWWLPRKITQLAKHLMALAA